MANTKKIIDANMHWLPGELFSDKKLLNSFLNCVPRQYGVHTRVEKIEGKDLHQLIVEQPKGYINLNYAEGQYTLESQLADMEKSRGGSCHLPFACVAGVAGSGDLQGSQLAHG